MNCLAPGTRIKKEAYDVPWKYGVIVELKIVRVLWNDSFEVAAVLKYDDGGDDMIGPGALHPLDENPRIVNITLPIAAGGPGR